MRLPEQLIIRPPTEAHSLLIRATRGCNWNRCRFCGIYPHLGQPTFEARSAEEVCADIDASSALYGDSFRTAFLGDADPLMMDPQAFCTIASHLRAAFPGVQRLTCYARAATCWYRKKHLQQYRAAGLDRVHIGLETGSTELLSFHDKGVNQEVMIRSGQAVLQAGLELSYYVLLGLGGADRWEEHVRETLRVLNVVQPQFVRFRRLWVFGSDGGPHCPLWEDVQAGRFIPQSPEGTVHEMRALLAGMDFATEVEATHNNIYVPLQGRLPEGKDRLLSKIDGFLSRPEEERRRRYEREAVI